MPLSDARRVQSDGLLDVLQRLAHFGLQKKHGDVHAFPDVQLARRVMRRYAKDWSVAFRALPARPAVA